MHACTHCKYETFAIQGLKSLGRLAIEYIVCVLPEAVELVGRQFLKQQKLADYRYVDLFLTEMVNEEKIKLNADN